MIWSAWGLYDELNLCFDRSDGCASSPRLLNPHTAELTLQTILRSKPSPSYTSNTFFYRIPWISPLLSWPYISNREGMQYYDYNYRLYYLRRLRRNVCNQSEVASSAIFYIVVVGAEERAIANKLWKKVRKADQWLKEHLSWTLCRQWQGRGRQVGHAEPSARF